MSSGQRSRGNQSRLLEVFDPASRELLRERHAQILKNLQTLNPLVLADLELALENELVHTRRIVRNMEMYK